jgi:serine-type D-Ala-D-Ala carboxypeptidase (penicillin-binding protein 5/6)
MRARGATRRALAAATALMMLIVVVAPAAAAAAPTVAGSRSQARSASDLDDADVDVARSSYATAPPSDLPARAFVLMLEGSGKIVDSDAANEELPIASTTKLMTAYVTLQHEPLTKVLVEQPYSPQEADESRAPVPAGTRLDVADMLRAMLLPSGNNVAYSLAIDVAGSTAAFVALMNEDAAALHLGLTHYTTPIGLDTPPGNYSTATDLAKLARVLMRDRVFREIVDEPRAVLADGIVVENRNDLVGAYPWVVGVKTGNTADAGECLVGAASLDGLRLISVVLGTPSEAARDADTLALLRYGLREYRSARVSVAGRVYATVPVAGRSRRATLVAGRSATLVLARSVALHVSLDVPRRLRGPLASGTAEGSLAVTENGRAVASVPLVTAASVPPPRPTADRRVRPAVWLAAGCGLAVVVVGCSLPFMRRRAARRPGGVPR